MTSNSNKKTYIIAEAGVNHNGSIKIAKSLIYQAKKAGANAIKFQLFETNSMVTKYSTLAKYQKNSNVNSQYELIKNLEINGNFLKDIISYSKKLNIDFMISIFDEKSLKLINYAKASKSGFYSSPVIVNNMIHAIDNKLRILIFN